jgi:hypothetical protein
MPRIRKRDAPILRYLSRITAIFGIAALGVLIFGIILGDLLSDIAHPWLTVSITLFVVSLVLLALVVRDQRKAIKAVDAASQYSAQPGAGAEMTPAEAGVLGSQATGSLSAAVHVASVECGRIAALGGIVNLLWLAILVLMVWQP